MQIKQDGTVKRFALAFLVTSLLCGCAAYSGRYDDDLWYYPDYDRVEYRRPDHDRIKHRRPSRDRVERYHRERDHKRKTKHDRK